MTQRLLLVACLVLRRNRSVSISSIVMLLLPSIAAASPFLASDVVVGAEVSGRFAYDRALVVSAASGQYMMLGGDNIIFLTVGALTFETSLGSPNALVRVTNGVSPGNEDFIQISSTGDNESFGGYLSPFARQNPNFNPRGALLLTFHFPNTYLADDSLPGLFDPLQTIGPVPGSSFRNIFGQVEGVSTQSLLGGIREWAFFFEIDPNDMVVTSDDSLVRGVFTGHIVEVDDRTQVGSPVAIVPEPSTLLLLSGGIAALIRRRQFISRR